MGRESGGIRLFVAIEISDRARAILARVQDPLRPQGRLLKIVDPQLFHLTVRFLGPTPSLRVPAVERAAAMAASRIPSFGLRLGGVGTFPARGAPRVIWVGLEDSSGLETLRGLYRDLEAELVSAGFEPERRPLSAHLTLARVRDTASSADAMDLLPIVDAMRAGPTLDTPVEVDALTVMRSDLGPGGPRYTPLSRVPLATMNREGRT